MKVSVIIPIYNVEEYIEECIRSVVAQSFTDYEVILVDDCGADRSVELAIGVLSSSNSKDRFKIVRHKKNRGLSAARNSGVEVAEGEFVLFIDSDDTISSDCFYELVSAAESTKADVTIGDISVDGVDTWVPTLSIPSDKQNNRSVFDITTIKGKENVLRSYINREWYVMAWNKLVRRDFLLSECLQFKEGLVHEDNPWSFQLACSANSITLVNKKTYIYRVRENSLQTDKNFAKHFDAYKSILQMLADIIVNKRAEQFSLSWFEKQKALFFSEVMIKGTTKQTHDMYSLIRGLLPYGHFTKTEIHYLMPGFIGYYLYRKFHGYYLCNDNG